MIVATIEIDPVAARITGIDFEEALDFELKLLKKHIMEEYFRWVSRNMGKPDEGIEL